MVSGVACGESIPRHGTAVSGDGIGKAKRAAQCAQIGHAGSAGPAESVASGVACGVSPPRHGTAVSGDGSGSAIRAAPQCTQIDKCICGLGRGCKQTSYG